MRLCADWTVRGESDDSIYGITSDDDDADNDDEFNKLIYFDRNFRPKFFN